MTTSLPGPLPQYHIVPLEVTVANLLGVTALLVFQSQREQNKDKMSKVTQQFTFRAQASSPGAEDRQVFVADDKQKLEDQRQTDRVQTYSEDGCSLVCGENKMSACDLGGDSTCRTKLWNQRTSRTSWTSGPVGPANRGWG